MVEAVGSFSFVSPLFWPAACPVVRRTGDCVALAWPGGRRKRLAAYRCALLAGVSAALTADFVFT